MKCNLACESTPFFLLINKNISPMSEQLSSSLEIRTFPMNPVPPVTRILLLENHTGIDGNFVVIFLRDLKNILAKYLPEKGKKRSIRKLCVLWDLIITYNFSLRIFINSFFYSSLILSILYDVCDFCISNY